MLCSDIDNYFLFYVVCVEPYWTKLFWETRVSADTFSRSDKAAVLQKFGKSWKPVAFASQTTSDTQQQYMYAQLENQTLTTLLASEKFTNFIILKQLEM